MIITIPISVGELLDKISILSIKSEHTMSDYVTKELKDLTEIAKKNGVYDDSCMFQLQQVNRKLWKIEDDLRDHEKLKRFNQEFIDLARSVYITNEQRSSIKRMINEKYNSQYKEIKVYDLNKN